MQRLEQAVVGLEQALHTPPPHQPWRRIARQRLKVVRDALREERASVAEAWLSARAGHLRRERNRLLRDVAVLRRMLGTEGADEQDLRRHLHRLALDLHHHQQRVNDLAYDAVALDVGGSE